LTSGGQKTKLKPTGSWSLAAKSYVSTKGQKLVWRGFFSGNAVPRGIVFIIYFIHPKAYPQRQLFKSRLLLATKKASFLPKATTQTKRL